MFLIDDRAGSKNLYKLFPEGEAVLTRLNSGDVAFSGNGPDNSTWIIGIEYKKINDMVACIKSGRFTGTQLPGMLRDFDLTFLLIEGKVVTDFRDKVGYLVEPRRGKQVRSLGLTYKAYANWLAMLAVHTALTGRPCIIHSTEKVAQSIAYIRGLCDLFQKPFEKHKAVWKIDHTQIVRISREVDIVVPKIGDTGYPQHYLQKVLYQVAGFGIEVSRVAAEAFGTVKTALDATEKDWKAIPGVGKTLAKRAYISLHGY